MICPQFYDAMCFSQWPYKWWHPKNDFILVAWVSCGGHFKHNHHLPWHWPLVVAVQEKQSHDLLLLMLWWWPWNVESNDFFRAKRDIRTGMDFSQRCCHSSFPIFRFNVKTREDLTCTRISKAKTRDFSAAAGRRTENQTFRRIFPECISQKILWMDLVWRHIFWMTDCYWRCPMTIWRKFQFQS